MKAALSAMLDVIASRLECPVKQLRFDHEPALRVRQYNPRIKDIAARYTPNANDPSAMTIRPQSAEYERSHHIKTNVRGEHGQYPDVVLIKRERRRERAAYIKKLAGKPVNIFKAVAATKRKIQKRRNPWPKGRKMGTRK